jgi:dCTP deaminase
VSVAGRGRGGKVAPAEVGGAAGSTPIRAGDGRTETPAQPEPIDSGTQTGRLESAGFEHPRPELAAASFEAAIDPLPNGTKRSAAADESEAAVAEPAGPADLRVGGEVDDTPGAASKPRTLSGIWSRQTIETRAMIDILFADEDRKSVFDSKRLDPASYRLAIGGEIYISPAKAKEKASVTFLEPRKAFFIPPGQFAFLLSEEVVKVPADAFALIALRTRTKFKGLVNVSGFHADPGYHGRLIFAVFNAGPGDVHLRRGDDLFTISFASLDETTEKPRSEEERFLHIPSEIIMPIAGEVQSLAGLKDSIDEVQDELGDRLNAIEREVAILRWAIALALSIVVGLLVRIISSG